MGILAAPNGQSSIVAGSYLATWNGLDLGLVAVGGYTLRYRNSSIPITADIAGESKIDGIYTGTRPSISMVLNNWNAAAVEPLIWWVGTQNGYVNYEFGKTNGVGLKEFDAAKPLVLTACHQSGGSATEANPTIDPLSITFFKTLLSPDTDVDIIFSHQPRFLSLTLDIMAVSVTGSEQPVISRVNNCGAISFWSALRNEGEHLAAVIDADVAGT
jgi:hypothetical protein